MDSSDNKTVSASTPSAQPSGSVQNAVETTSSASRSVVIKPLKLTWKGIVKGVLSYFNVSNDLLPQQDAETEIRSGVSFKGSQLLILIFAIFVASLGLNTDSVPVVIGAMLISPLMGPIIGMGLGIGIHDYGLLRRGAKNVLMAIIGSIIASAIYFLISPQYEGSSQLLARTSPSIYDVFIALFGGAAGIVSIACKNKGQVMPGVAIATSLMPPLCTAGYGLATFQMNYFFGALYLFFTNAVFILFATWIGVKVMGYKAIVYQDTRRARHVQLLVTIIVGMTVVLSGYLTFRMISQNIFYANADRFVQNDMVFPNTQVLNHKEYIRGGKRYIDVTLIGQALPKDSLQVAMLNKLDSVGLGGTILNIKQGFSLSVADEVDSRNAGQFYSMMQSEIVARQHTIDSLNYIIAHNRSFPDDASSIAPEIKVLFPGIRDIAVSNMLTASVDNDRADTLSLIFVNAPAGLTSTERQRLDQYIEVRLSHPNVSVVVNPSGFPWPDSDN